MIDIEVNGEVRFCLREVFHQCFTGIDEKGYEKFCFDYLAGWILGDLAGECSFEMPVDPESVEEKFAIYAENTNNDGSWLSVWNAYVDGMKQNLLDLGPSGYAYDEPSDVQRFIMRITDELLLPECLTSRGWM